MKSVIVDNRIDKEEEASLRKAGFNIIKCPSSDLLYEAINGHPDILLNLVEKNKILVHKNISEEFIYYLTSIGMEVFLSNSSLSSAYPGDIILNALNLKNHFLHNLKFTDNFLKELVKEKKMINIKQGYSRCSTAVVSENAFMTSDKGIYKALSAEGFDVLLLPTGDIILPGLDYGFIGGCCGLLETGILAFYGDLDYYQYGMDATAFLEKHGVKPLYLRKGKLYDRGSMFVVSNINI